MLFLIRFCAYISAFYQQEYIQKDKDGTLRDDTESRMASDSDSVRASEDVPQSLPSPVPKSPIQLPSQHMSHTSTDIALAEGR